MTHPNTQACCIRDGCGAPFDTTVPELRDTGELRAFWSRYCPAHRATDTPPVIVTEVRHILKTGDRAYYDSFSGLIPCKVISITGHSGMVSSRQEVRAMITARKPRGGWRRGDIATCWALHVAPRTAVHVRSGQYRIRPYYVQCD